MSFPRQPRLSSSLGCDESIILSLIDANRGVCVCVCVADSDLSQYVAEGESQLSCQLQTVDVQQILQQNREQTHSKCTVILQQPLPASRKYSGTSNKGPSEIGTTSLQRTLVSTPC